MRTIAMAFAMSFLASSAFAQAPATKEAPVLNEATLCKGLDQPSCEALSHCRWMAERIAGQTMTKAGRPSKTSAKAHCRTGQRAKQK